MTDLHLRIEEASFFLWLTRNHDQASSHGDIKNAAQRQGGHQGVLVAQAARDLDVHENVLRKLLREAAAEPQEAFPAKGVMKPEQAESSA